MSEKWTIPILTDDFEGTQRNVLPTLSGASRRVSDVASELLSRNLQHFLRTFEKLLDSSDFSTSRFAIDQIELNLVVNAEGSIELVGKVSSGVVASMKVTLKRKTV